MKFSLPHALSGFAKAHLLFLCIFALIYPFIPVEQLFARDPYTGQTLTFLRSHTTRAPFHELWALDGFRDFQGAGRLIPGILLVTFLVVYYLKNESKRLERWLPLIIAPLAFAAFYSFRVSIEKNALFGDGPRLPIEVPQGLVFAAEVLTMHCFDNVYRFTHWLWGFDGAQAIQFTSCLFGGLFVSAIIVLAQTLTDLRPLRALFVVGAIGAGYGILFLGYIETTVVETTAMAWFFAAAAKLLFHGAPQIPMDADLAPNANTHSTPRSLPSLPAWSKHRETIWLIVFTLAYSACLLAHAAGLVMSAAYLLTLIFFYFSSAAFHAGRHWLGYVVKNAVLFIVLVLIPVYELVLAPFFFRGVYGNTTGGGDGIMFVPISYDTPPSVFTHYKMFSWLHAVDIFNSMACSAPLVFLAPPAAWFILREARQRSAWRDPWLQFLLVILCAGACALAVPLIWQFDFGMWGDWNLAATYLFPLHMFVWTAILHLYHARRMEGALLSPGLPLIACQVVLALGMLCQLY